MFLITFQFMKKVLESAWNNLMKDVANGGGSLDRLLLAHEMYLNNVCSRSFVTKDDAAKVNF
jgi:hypothetical protein